MVDADVEIPGLIEKGKLLTLTTEEALKHKVADFRAETLERRTGAAGSCGGAGKARIAQLGGGSCPLPDPSRCQLSAHDRRYARHLSGNPHARLWLAGALGIASLALFFWGHWLVQLAGWEEMLLVASGLVLLVLEIFVIPGFGLAGVLGIGALLAGLSLSLIGGGATWEFVAIAVGAGIDFSPFGPGGQPRCCCVFYRACRSAGS